MMDGSLSAALEREHREIDGGIETFIKQLAQSSPRSEPLLEALRALRRHIYLEEVFLFQPLREAGLATPIFVMMREHGHLWRAMQSLTGLLETGADNDHVLDVCRQLLAQLDRHNSKEEPVIYRHADLDLPAPTRAELTRFMETGHTPEGWVCQQAGLPAEA